MSQEQTTPVEAVNPTTTQEPSGEAVQTTQAEAAKPATTQPEAVKQEEKPILTTEQLKERLEREREKYRKEFEAEAAEREKRAKMETQERLELEKQEAIKLAEAEKQEKAALAQQVKDMRTLTGKVADIDAALDLVKPEHRNEDGSLNTELFLTRYSFLKPQATTSLSQPSAKTVLEKPADKMTDEEYFRSRTKSN